MGKQWKRKGRKRTGKDVSCAICGKLVYRKGYSLHRYSKHYCSMSCKGIDNAKRINEKYKNKPRKWQIGSKNKSWRGEKAGYNAKHDWIRLHYGKAIKCTNNRTHKFKIYDWANISGEFKRDISDWKQLCRPCHRALDRGTEIGKFVKCLVCKKEKWQRPSSIKKGYGKYCSRECWKSRNK